MFTIPKAAPFQLAVALLLALGSVSAFAAKPSILFINIDDLNDWNGTLRGHPQAITPNLDRLAKRGVTFSRAICASPVCFPSRTAMFTGIRPTRSGAISNFNWARPWRFYAGDVITLPKHLERNGWKTFGAGKNFHGGNKPEFQSYFPQPREAKAIKGSGYVAGPLGWGIADCSYEEMPDHLVASWGIEQIRNTTDPMFLSLGIYKPHVKWILPQSCFDKYPLEEFQEPVKHTNDLADLPGRLRLLAHNEAKFNEGYQERLRRDGQVKLWARAYLAAVTFADEQLGRLLDAWDASPHSKNGIIVLWSDHGFMLGEKEGWGKFKPWFDAIHLNLIVAGPGIPQGRVCNKAVSLLDLYPTLLDLLNTPGPENQTWDGKSLLPLLTDPNAAWDRPVVMSHEEDGVRYDVVMDNRFRMTRLITGETELYDLDNDPHEWRNLAAEQRFHTTVQRLSKHLTFKIRSLPENGWLEAESLPCQTSADYGRRGNFHYPRPNAEAAGGQYLCAELKKGKGSYVDFVLQAEQTGDYELSVALGAVNRSTRISVTIGSVVADARQATSDYPMRPVGKGTFTLKRNRGFTTLNLGRMKILKPGPNLLRISSEDASSILLRIDRLRVRRAL